MSHDVFDGVWAVCSALKTPIKLARTCYCRNEVDHSFMCALGVQLICTSSCHVKQAAKLLADFGLVLRK
eukprot:2707496-Amphidinium_carterae.2